MSAYLTPAQKAEAVALAARQLLDVTKECEIDDEFCATHAEDIELIPCEVGEARSVLRLALGERVVTSPAETLAQYVSGYRIPIVPADHRLAVFSDVGLYAIEIIRTGPDWRGVNTSEDTWKIANRNQTWCTDSAFHSPLDGEWEYEARPSEREEDWFRRARFSLADAQRIVEHVLPLELAKLDAQYGERADNRIAEKAAGR